MLKKFFKVLVTLGFLIAFSLPVLNVHAAEGNEDEANEIVKLNLSEKEIERLGNLGFTKDEIENMSKEEYEMNKNLDGEVVSESVKYVKVIEDTTSNRNSLNYTNKNPNFQVIELSEDQYNKEVAETSFNTFSSDDKSTSYKKMVTTITKLSSVSFRVKNSVTWSKIPLTRNIDVSGIGINSSYWFPRKDSEYGKQNWKTLDYFGTYRNRDATYTTDSNKWKKGTGGYALKMNLPNNDSYFTEDVVELSSYMYYTVYTETSTKHLDAYGQYAHQESIIGITPSISISGVEFTLSEEKKFSFHPNTHAVYYR
ncbi:hypothetical protein [Rummeliibacillus suwonensis]|uniref:hypothetical protein n=1 Tax=Rummeliibacillus suwonensis TaxID=1306154 RepID=UPI0011B546BD|nr:hypothetical protein [Rummeliibacillus suwonensis]